MFPVAVQRRAMQQIAQRNAVGRLGQAVVRRHVVQQRHLACLTALAPLPNNLFHDRAARQQRPGQQVRGMFNHVIADNVAGKEEDDMTTSSTSGLTRSFDCTPTLCEEGDDDGG